MVARKEAQMSGRVREAEELARAARRVEEEAAARVESFPVIVARVEAETTVRVESLQARVNNKNGYQQKRCRQPQCQNLLRGIFGVCVRHGHMLKKCNRKGCNNIAQRKGFCKTHREGRICLVDGCLLAIFKGLKCNYHYNIPDVQCEVVVMDQPSIMSFDQHVVQNILQFAGGWDN